MTRLLAVLATGFFFSFQAVAQAPGTADGTWQFIGGTGDMAKISGGGTYKAIAQMPNGNTVSWWEGKWSTD